ncbi:MAG: Fe-S cluster assembly protein SufD [Mangrovibacterium sp.]
MIETSKYNNALTANLVKLYEEYKAQIWNLSSDALNNFRADALVKFSKLGVPSFKNEDYKYTRIDKVISPDLSIAGIADCCSAEPSFPSLEAHQMVFCNGVYGTREVKEDLPEGVVLTSLKQAAKQYPELLKKYYNTLTSASADAMVAFNTMLAFDGLFVYIPEGVQLEMPIQISISACGKLAQVASQRNLVVLEKGAKATILFEEHNRHNSSSMLNVVTEYVVNDEAELNVNIIQDFLSNFLAIDSQFYRLAENAQAHQTLVSLNAGVTRNNLKVDLQGENAEMTMNGMSILNNKQHVDNFTSITHAVPNCLSNQLYKNVLDGESSGAFSGRIKVVRDAQKTNAFQRNNNVLLSKEAKMNTKPQLIIDADDVKCSHGATVGQIDEEVLFYMQARGIGARQARMMLMKAFCHEVIQEIRNEFIRDIITELAEVKLNKAN